MFCVSNKPLYILSICLIFIFSCKKKKTKEESPPPICHVVVDKDTQQRLAGVYMQFYQGSGWFAYNSLNATTDNNGSMCQSESPKFTTVNLTKTGYILETATPNAALKFEMQASAYVRIHLKNDLPASSSDHININCRPEIAGNLGENFLGIIDSTITREVDPRIKYITWSAGSAVQTVTYTAVGNQTVNININY